MQEAALAGLGLGSGGAGLSIIELCSTLVCLRRCALRLHRMKLFCACFLNHTSSLELRYAYSNAFLLHPR
jgi:hypothetical protein